LHLQDLVDHGIMINISLMNDGIKAYMGMEPILHALYTSATDEVVRHLRFHGGEDSSRGLVGCDAM